MLVHFCAEVVEQADSRRSPLDNDIVTGFKHGCDLDSLDSGAAAVVGVVLQSTLSIILFQGHNPDVYEQTTVAVFRQAGEQLRASKMNVQQRLHGLHE